MITLYLGRHLINKRLKLFAHGNLRVHIISYLPQVGQIISYLPTQNKYYFLRVQIIINWPMQINNITFATQRR